MKSFFSRFSILLTIVYLSFLQHFFFSLQLFEIFCMFEIKLQALKYFYYFLGKVNSVDINLLKLTLKYCCFSYFLASKYTINCINLWNDEKWYEIFFSGTSWTYRTSRCARSQRLPRSWGVIWAQRRKRKRRPTRSCWFKGRQSKRTLAFII